MALQRLIELHQEFQFSSVKEEAFKSFYQDCNLRSESMKITLDERVRLAILEMHERAAQSYHEMIQNNVQTEIFTRQKENDRNTLNVDSELYPEYAFLAMNNLMLSSARLDELREQLTSS